MADLTILVPNSSSMAQVQLPERLNTREVREALALVWRQVVEQVPAQYPPVKRAKPTVKRPAYRGSPAC